MTRFVLRVLARWPTYKMLRIAAMLGVVAATVMAWSVIASTPLPIVTSMTLSPILGGIAFLIFALSIAADLAHARSHSSKTHLKEE